MRHSGRGAIGKRQYRKPTDETDEHSRCSIEYYPRVIEVGSHSPASFEGILMMVIRTLVAVSCMALVSSQLRADMPDQPKAGTQELSIEHGGLTRTYRLHVPPSYDGSRPVPL